MAKRYPRLPAEVVREQELMSEDELAKAAGSSDAANDGEKLPAKEVEGSNHSPPPGTPCHNDSLKNTQSAAQANDVPNAALPPTQAQINKEIGKDYTLALHFKAREIREKVSKGLPLTSDDRADLRLLDDLKRGYDYTIKFEKEIRDNPSKLIRPGSMGGAAAQDVRNLETQLRKQNKKDHRKSSTPPRPSSGDGIVLPA